MHIPHVEEAREIIIEQLLAAPYHRDRDSQYTNQRPGGADISVHNIVEGYFSKQGYIMHIQGKVEAYYVPFYDAAWELCRIGVLRPGEVAPAGSGYSTFRGDHFALTGYGADWIKLAAERPNVPSDPSKLIDVLATFKTRFGNAFFQRAMEAVRCHRHTTYLACCVMAGAAAESILLAVAVAKAGDENEVISQYRGASGRKNILKAALGNVSAATADSFRSSFENLVYWRDEAGHGQTSAIAEIQAHTALSQLLRLSQFASDRWEELTKPHKPRESAT